MCRASAHGRWTCMHAWVLFWSSDEHTEAGGWSRVCDSISHPLHPYPQISSSMLWISTSQFCIRALSALKQQCVRPGALDHIFTCHNSVLQGMACPAFWKDLSDQYVPASEKSYLRRNRKAGCCFNWICFPFTFRLSREKTFFKSTHCLLCYYLRSIILIMGP